MQGTLKGLTGIICDVSAHDVYVELHSQFKKVHVLRQNVALLDAAGNIVESKLVGAAVTPSTPRSMHSGAATPLREPRTPMVSAAFHFCWPSSNGSPEELLPGEMGV